MSNSRKSLSCKCIIDTPSARVIDLRRDYNLQSDISKPDPMTHARLFSTTAGERFKLFWTAQRSQ